MRVHSYHEPAILRWALVAMALALVLLIASVAAACPTCKEGLAQNDPHGQSIAAGYYYSIIFMMSMPYIVLGTFVSIAYYSVRRAKAANLAADGSEIEVAEAALNSDDAI